MLERKVPVPLYHQLELQLRSAIESGVYRSGEKLPTESELMETYEVSRVTVRTALKRLEEDGLISSRRGSGTFVTAQASARQIERHSSQLLGFEEDLIQQAGAPTIELLSVEAFPAPQRIAQLLNVAPGIESTRIRRAGSVAGEPLWIESRWIHPDFLALLDALDLTSASLTALYEQQLGVTVESSKLRISAAAATREQARILHIGSGDPVLINDYAVYTESRAIDATRSVFRSDRYAFSFEVFAPGGQTNRQLQGAFPPGGMLSVLRQEVSA